MHNEIKCFCKDHKWREAIEFVSRIEPEPRSGKTEALIILGSQIIANMPLGKKRDGYLFPIIEAFLQLGDTENPQSCLLALHSDAIREKFAGIIQDSLFLRHWDCVYRSF